MEFNFNTEEFFKCDEDGIGIVESKWVNNTNKNLIKVFDELGEASSKVKNC
jgi:hypothetical protein